MADKVQALAFRECVAQAVNMVQRCLGVEEQGGETMNWTPVGESKRCIASDEGYLVSKYSMPEGFAYIARTPAPASKILYSGECADKAKAACIDHFELTRGKAA